MKQKIILDLCGGTGSWSMPYKEAGYEVYNITLPDFDIFKTGKGVEEDNGAWIGFRNNMGNYKVLVYCKDIYGILSAPPCVQFSFARTNAKNPRDLRKGMELVNKCLEIIQFCQYHIKSDVQKYSPLKFWALENPYYGMLRWFLGEPIYTFNPFEFGHNYQKKTAVWGYFNFPEKNPIEMTPETKAKAKTNSQAFPKFDYMSSKSIAPEWFGKLDRQARRAITPAGFAKAFFESNK